MKAQDMIGHWVHSHEEDSAEGMIFRPASFGFPRSRGRDSFDLRVDALIEHGPGPGDAPTEGQGSWKFTEDGRLSFFRGAGKKPSRVLRVVSVQPDRLIVRTCATIEPKSGDGK